MKILISPSKTMDYQHIEAIKPGKYINPQLSKSLLQNLHSLDFDALKKLYKSSDKVINDTIALFEHQKHYPAIQLFNGAVFKNLDYPSLQTTSKKYIDENTLIFSALYGLLPASTGIQAYRLDLKDKLEPSITNLKKQWQPSVINYLNSLEDSTIIDLASSEYRALINPKNLNKDYIRIEFKDNKNGSYKPLGTYAKMARGQFLQLMAKENIINKEQLRTLSPMNYVYNPELSDESTYIFTRQTTSHLIS